MATLPAAGQTCPRCNTPGQLELFCQICGLFLPDTTGSTERVTFTRRFFGDLLLEGLLVIVTLIIGWVIWFALSASKAQSPAKRLLNVYVIDADTGRAVGGGRMWVRDVLLKILVIGNIPFGNLIDGLFVLFDKERQSVHDKITSTVIVYAPRGLPQSMLSTWDAAQALPAGQAAAPPPAGTPPAPAPAAPPAPLSDVAARLRELQKLRDEGAITAEEYEAKRSELARQL
jgi:uncharacterized RDD family membrane protein YckC